MSNQWINLSDKRPDCDGEYLALLKGFTYEMGNSSDLVPKISYWNGGRGCFHEDYGNELFTHWMPLPALPNLDN